VRPKVSCSQLAFVEVSRAAQTYMISLAVGLLISLTAIRPNAADAGAVTLCSM
jgi:hypothetical protein